MDDQFQFKRQFVAYYFFVSWDCISLGINISFSSPNFEIHLPFGFIRIGWVFVPLNLTEEQLKFSEEVNKRSFGFNERY